MTQAKRIVSWIIGIVILLFLIGLGLRVARALIGVVMPALPLLVCRGSLVIDWSTITKPARRRS